MLVFPGSSPAQCDSLSAFFFFFFFLDFTHFTGTPLCKLGKMPIDYVQTHVSKATLVAFIAGDHLTLAIYVSLKTKQSFHSRGWSQERVGGM